MALTEIEQRFLAGHRRGRLATVASGGAPQVKPVGFAYNGELGTIDIGGFNMAQSAKYKNIRRNPNVAFVVDDVVGEGMEGVRFLEIRGVAEALPGPVTGPYAQAHEAGGPDQKAGGPDQKAGGPDQKAGGPDQGESSQRPRSHDLAPEIIRIHPTRVIGFNVDPDRPGFSARDAVTGPDAGTAHDAGTSRDPGAARDAGAGRARTGAA